MNHEQVQAYNKGYKEGYENALLSVFKWNEIPVEQRYNNEFYPKLKERETYLSAQGKVSEDMIVLTKYGDHHIAFFYETYDGDDLYWVTHSQLILQRYEVEAWCEFKKKDRM